MDFLLYTNNAFNVAGFMNKNGLEYENPPAALMTIMYFVMCLILAAVYLMKRNRANLLLLSSFIYFILAYFMANANPLTAIPGLVLLLFACAAIGDRRLFGQYLILSFVCLLNISAVMIAGKFMNATPDYLFDVAKNPEYTVELLKNGAAATLEKGGAPALSNGLMIAGSVIALLSFLYFMYIAMDITVANRRKVFLPFDKENPHYAFDTIRSIFK